MVRRPAMLSRYDGIGNTAANGKPENKRATIAIERFVIEYCFRKA
jgi:hypothetical protein